MGDKKSSRSRAAKKVIASGATADQGGKKKRSSQAIQGTRSTLFMVDPEELILVGRDTKDRAPHPLWDPRVLDDPDPRRVATIKRHGVIEPVVVRKVDGAVEVVDGRGRVIDCRAANIDLELEGKEQKKVPVKLNHGTDEEMFETMVITNHFTRKPSPVESAHLLNRYLSFEGKTEVDAVEIFGVTSRTIQNWIALLKLDPKVQGAVGEGKLSSSAAAKFVDLPKKEQRAKLKALVKSTPDGKRVSVTKAARGTGKASATQRAPSKKVVRKLLAYDDTLESGGLEDQFVLGVRWALGDVKDTDVEGMTILLRKLK